MEKALQDKYTFSIPLEKNSKNTYKRKKIKITENPSIRDNCY